MARHRTTGVVAMVLVVAMALTACGSKSSTAKKAASGPAATTTTLPKSTKLGVGVTATDIKVGISLINYKSDCLPEAAFPAIRLDQDKIYQGFIDNINNNGGVAGRKIVPIFKFFCPLPASPTYLATCTALTEDDNIFADIGTWYDTSGDAQTCIAGQHHRVLLTFDLTQSIMSKSPPGLIVTPASLPERLVRVLLELLKKRHTLDGKKVAVLGDANAASTVKDTIVPGLKQLGVALGTTGLLTFTNADTTVPQTQLDSFIERWKTEHVQAVFLSGYATSSTEFVRKLRQRMPNIFLLADNTQVLDPLRSLVGEGVKPNPYEGLITATGLTPKEYDASPNWKYCADIYKKMTGKVAPNAEQVIPYKGRANQKLDTYGVINDACQLLTMFRDIGNRVGKYLNNDNWVNTVNTFGHIDNKGTGPYSSLKAGKYDAEDNFRLSALDSSLGEKGDFRPITPLQNITG